MLVAAMAGGPWPASHGKYANICVFGFLILNTMISLLTLNIPAFGAQLKAALRDAAQEVADNMEAPTTEWSREHTPKFGVVGPDQDGSGNLVAFGGVLPGQGERAKIYLWVTRGTRERDIYPRPENRRGLLIFPYPYYPATTPRSWESQPAGVGEFVAKRPHVHHPGIEAREWEQEAAKIARKTLRQNMVLAITGYYSPLNW